MKLPVRLIDLVSFNFFLVLVFELLLFFIPYPFLSPIENSSGFVLQGFSYKFYAQIVLAVALGCLILFENIIIKKIHEVILFFLFSYLLIFAVLFIDFGIFYRFSTKFIIIVLAVMLLFSFIKYWVVNHEKSEKK